MPCESFESKSQKYVMGDTEGLDVDEDERQYFELKYIGGEKMWMRMNDSILN